MACDNCIFHVSQMQFRCSHIYREGNQAADALANMGLSSTGLTWWDIPPDLIRSHCRKDSLGLPNFRVR